ncbi:MAG: CoA ester lyase [Prevotella sp.]|jgi:citrate lyase subunit beta/citryl-CoA lyase|nr:CoA ester lyase [Prevotella sp.]
MKADFLMRSLMFVPAHNYRLLIHAADTEADILLLDIEDSAPYAENKQTARENIKNSVSAGLFRDKILFPRVNDQRSGQLLKDVYQLTIDGVKGFMYPKVKSADDIRFFSKLLETIEYEKSFPLNTFKIIPLIETANAVMNIQDICEACPERLVAVAFGSEDFIVDIGGWHDAEGDNLFTARSMIALGARAKGVIPIDTTHIQVHNLKQLKQILISSKKLGFEGMLVLHPKELPLVHEYYSPSESDVQWAKEVMLLSDGIMERGESVAIRNNKFIGPPIVKKAQIILDKQNMIEDKEYKLHGATNKYLLFDV